MKHTLSTKLFGLLALSGLALGSVQALASDDAAKDKAEAVKVVNGSVTVLQDFSADPNMTWYRDNVHKAKAVLIIPTLVKAGFIFGGSGGTGVVLVRDEATNTWKGPSFATAGSVSWGFQAGGSAAQVVMMAMTDKGKDALLSNKFQAGADASVAAGPVGVGAQAATVDILQFARSKGLFGGLSLEGSVIAVRDSLNHAYFGEPVTPVDILVKGNVRNPQADVLIKKLTAGAK
jgi:lipid-binding SYLF domain-containing protein